MTSGNILKNVIKFAIPCIITRLIQNLYPLIDSVIVGRLLSFEDLTAVGLAGSVYSLFNDTVIGLVSGFAIVGGKKFGAQNTGELNSVYASSFLMTILCGVAISAVGILLSGPLLLMLQTPADIVAHGRKYLFVLFLGFIPNAFYNFFCEMMRALGDSKGPLRLLIISSVLHLVLIIPLTRAFGISGTALATVISYLVTDIFAVRMMRKGSPRISFRMAGIGKSAVGECLQIGWPMALTQAVVMIGVLLLNLVTNKIGTDYTAAYSCASKIGYIMTTPIFGFGTAVAVFTTQNFGAKNYSNIRECINKTMKLVFAVNGVVFLLVLGVGRPILNFILSKNQVAVDAGMLYLMVRGCAMFILTPAVFYKSVLPAIGRPLFSTLSSFVEIGIRYLFPLLCSSVLGFVTVPLTDASVWFVLAIMLSCGFYYEFKKIIGAKATP